MKTLWEYKKLIFFFLIIVLIVVAAFQVEIRFKGQETTAPVENTGGTRQELKEDLPNQADFETVAENDHLILKFDDTFGHFEVEDKRNGNEYRSYPNPEQWENETIGGIWKDHIRSPIMFQYMDFSSSRSRPRESNFVTEGGDVQNIKKIENGIEFTLNMPGTGFTVPVRLRIDDDFVETTVIDSELTESNFSLIWLRLYPMFGAEHSEDPNGYMVIPDGSGALISFNEDSSNLNRVYHTKMYGRDYSFQDESSSRMNATAPVFGIQSDNKGFLAVIHEGEEYSELYASPGGVFSDYNWVTAQMRYRQTFFQTTNENTGDGFITYNKEEPFQADRSIRYHLLNEGQTDYVGMASRYRQHLMEVRGMERITNEDQKIPLHISFIGGATERGLVNDRYVTATSTSDAMQIVQKLYGLGVEKMSVTYLGWQQNGYASYGGLFPVEQRMGGTEGMKKFIQFAHSLDIPVYLQAGYMFNNTGGDGFVRRYHGARNLGGELLARGNFFNSFSMVSQQFLEQTVNKDLDEYEKLDADGIQFEYTGRYLNTDYNTNYGANRKEAKELHHRIFSTVQERLGSVQARSVNAFAFDTVDHIVELEDDYSFDLFSENRIPFLQIALHGLVSYTSEYANDREQYQTNFLRDLEYGALPAYIFTEATMDELMNAYDIWYTNPHFADWQEVAVQEYQQANQALGDVQDQFIVGHRTLTDGVNETTYENGKRIIVNYNKNPYSVDGIQVPAKDFIILERGKQQ